MNIAKLREAEERFLGKYPGGFSNPLIAQISKKHKVEKMNKLAQDSFAAENFEDTEKIIEAMGRVVSQSSLISVFEKPKFKDLIKALSRDEKERLSLGLKEFLHGNQESGFKLMAGLLKEYNLAKWPLLTVCPMYYRPDVEVFIKPTTAKAVIAYFELEGVYYSPNPTFEFYRAYRERINIMKKEVAKSMQVDNAAFCGFLMMSLDSSDD